MEQIPSPVGHVVADVPVFVGYETADVGNDVLHQPIIKNDRAWGSLAHHGAHIPSAGLACGRADEFPNLEVALV